jgi:hypothetical protein
MQAKDELLFIVGSKNPLIIILSLSLLGVAEVVLGSLIQTV